MGRGATVPVSGDGPDMTTEKTARHFPIYSLHVTSTEDLIGLGSHAQIIIN
jgi:hypothetical protein